MSVELRKPISITAKLEAIFPSQNPKDLKELTEEYLQSLAEYTKEQRAKSRSALARNLWQSRKRHQQRVRAKEKVIQLSHMQKLTDQIRETINSANKDCLEIAISVAERIVKESFDSQPGILHARIQELLQNLLLEYTPKVFVNPQDYEGLKKEIERANASALSSPSSTTWQYFPATEVQRGQAVITTPQGSIHFDWRGELEQLKELLRDSLKQKISAPKRQEDNSNWICNKEENVA